MSDLTKIIAEVELCVQSRSAMSSERLAHLRSAHQKYSMKMNDVDPVTGAPRYGRNMKDKLERLGTLLTGIQVLDESSTPEPQQRMGGPAGAPNSIFDATIMIQNNEREAGSASHAVRIEGANIGKYDAIKRFRTALQAHIASLNVQYGESALRSSHTSRSVAVSGALQQLLTEVRRRLNDGAVYGLTTYGQEPVCAAAALRATLAILDAVIRHPDDERLRMIRWRHPELKGKLSQCGISAMRLLLAAGFTLAAERLSAETAAWVDACAAGDGASPSGDLRLWGALLSSGSAYMLHAPNDLKYFILNKYAATSSDEATVGGLERGSCFDGLFRQVLRGPEWEQQDFVLTMKEPNIELDMDRWVLWFDELKESRDAVAVLVQ